jgi:hypothetical protein
MSTQTIPPTYLANTAVGFSAFILLNNTYILSNPTAGLKQLGFKLPAASKDDPETKNLAEGLLQMNAATRITLGFTSVAMWYYRDYRAMGWSMIGGCVMAVVDGWVADRMGLSNKWVHWGFAPVGVAIGGGLLAIVGIR